MTTRVPFTITNHTISFFAKGRMYSVNSGDKYTYASLRAALMTPDDRDHDIDDLIAHVDVRYGLIKQSQGQITLIDEEIVFQGKPLHNVWVEKILTYRAAGEPYGPIWNALNKLVHNPTPQAIERLPIFLERAALGFLPDGRFLAFKGVQADFRSAHASPDGTRFRHLVGDVCRMERKDVDPDPNQICSTGLHVGAPGYVKSHYSGGRYALVLVAVDPVDVVSVPVDYSGEKMRVCGYEVIAHLDQAYNDELLGTLRTTQSHGYGAPATPARKDDVCDAYVEPEDDFDPEDQDDAEDDEQDLWSDGLLPGDVVVYTELGAEFCGVVTSVDLDGALAFVEGPDGPTEIDESDFIRRVEPADVLGAMVARVGDTIRIAGHAALRDGDFLIVALNDDDGDAVQTEGDDAFFVVSVLPDGDAGDIIVTNGLIQAVIRDGATVWPSVRAEDQLVYAVTGTGLDTDEPQITTEVLGTVAEVIATAQRQIEIGDKVTLVGDEWPPAGVYPVSRLADNGLPIVSTEYDGEVVVEDVSRISAVRSRPWTRVSIGDAVTLIASDLSGVRAGLYEVVDIRLDESDVFPEGQLQVRTLRGPWWVDAARVTAVKKA